MATIDDKKALRRQVRAQKSQLTAEAVRAASADIFRQLEELPEFGVARTVMAYWSMDDEVATHEAIERWSADRRVALPVVVGDSLELRLYDPSQMLPGYRGILEPGSDATKVEPYEVDLAVIPGMAFDSEGHRLGRGGGFYDHLLPQLACMKVGVCLDCQKVAEVPCEEHDCMVDKVITNTR